MNEISIYDLGKKLHRKALDNNGKIKFEFDGLYIKITIYKGVGGFDLEKPCKKIAKCTVGNGFFGILWALDQPLNQCPWTDKE